MSSFSESLFDFKPCYDGPPGDYKLTFGKYKGQSLAQVKEVDPKYMGYLLKSKLHEKFIDRVKAVMADSPL